MHWLSKRSTKIIMVLPALILFVGFVIIPIFISVYYSVTDFTGIGEVHFIGLKNYRVLFHDKFFFIALKNTFIILICITITVLPISFLVALLLEKSFKGKRNHSIDDLCAKCSSPNPGRLNMAVYFRPQNGTD